MASSLNRAQILGNMTADPEMRQTPSGQAVCTVRVATNRRWKNQAGEQQEDTEFHSVVCWGKLAEIVGQYLKKGSKVFFEGRLKTRSWEDEGGKKNFRTEIVAENMMMLDSRGAAAGAAPAPQSKEAPAKKAASPAADEEVEIEDLPF